MEDDGIAQEGCRRRFGWLWCWWDRSERRKRAGVAVAEAVDMDLWGVWAVSLGSFSAGWRLGIVLAEDLDVEMKELVAGLEAEGRN